MAASPQLDRAFYAQLGRRRIRRNDFSSAFGTSPFRESRDNYASLTAFTGCPLLLDNRAAIVF